jgi:hypothetical protein
MKRIALLLTLPGFLSLGHAQEPTPAINGYITRAVSRGNFDVNGIRVISTPRTEFVVKKVAADGSIRASGALYLGMPIQVFGDMNHNEHTVTAARVVMLEAESPTVVKGFGLIDRLLMPISSEGPGRQSILVRADGYAVQVDEKTSSVFTAPLASLDEIHTDVWLSFSGQQRADGVVVADKVVFVENEINEGEVKLRDKSEYDAAGVDPDAKQNLVHEAFIGWDPKKAHPYVNAEMQNRVNRIGASLVPEYQRSLPNSDPTKVQFRFQLIDKSRLKDAVALPSGIILVPWQVVERMQNDSQLAAVLADNIACTLEKQVYLAQSTNHKMLAALVASEAAGVFVPGLGAAAWGTEAGANSVRARRAENKTGRIALGLMNDAKYDINQAPLGWWLLASKNPKPLKQIELPARAANLYRIIGENWRSGSPLRQ